MGCVKGNNRTAVSFETKSHLAQRKQIPLSCITQEETIFKGNNRVPILTKLVKSIEMVIGLSTGVAYPPG